VLADTEFVLQMLSENEFVAFHDDADDMEFDVSDRMRKTDSEIKADLVNRYGICDPMQLSDREDKNAIISELKKYSSARQIERITGISRKKI